MNWCINGKRDICVSFGSAEISSTKGRTRAFDLRGWASAESNSLCALVDGTLPTIQYRNYYCISSTLPKQRPQHMCEIKSDHISEAVVILYQAAS